MMMTEEIRIQIIFNRYGNISILQRRISGQHGYVIPRHLNLILNIKIVITIVGQTDLFPLGIIFKGLSIIDNLMFKDISGRLADFFLHEAEATGKPSERGIILQLDLTMEQLAAIIGSSRQTVSTILSAMQRAVVQQGY